jgi:hypothetical protein
VPRRLFLSAQPSLTSTLSQHEFGRLAKQLEFEKMHLPTTSAAAKIKANLDKHKDYIMTEVRYFLLPLRRS